MKALIISILTLNIWGLPDAGFKVIAPLKSERVSFICETLKNGALQKTWDIILLQEVWVKKDRDTLKNCGYPHALEKEENRPLDSGLMILSRFPLESAQRLTYPTLMAGHGNLKHGEGLSRKSALIARVSPEGSSTFWIANTHLVSNYDKNNDIYFSDRMNQLRRFAQWALQFPKEKEGLVIGGDFNFDRTDREWVELEALFNQFAEAPESKSACTLCPPNTLHPTNDGKVDHLLASKELRPVQGKVTFEKLLQMGDFSISPSDHLGWETQFQLIKD